jgi:hypothetical protein
MDIGIHGVDGRIVMYHVEVEYSTGTGHVLSLFMVELTVQEMTQTIKRHKNQ